MRQGRAAGNASGLLALGLVLSLIGLGALTAALADRSLVGAAFPMLVATLRDQTGSYTSGFLVLLTLAAAGAIAVSLLPGGARTPTPAAKV